MALIEPIYDPEDDLWFAGTYTGLPTGPIGQRGEFFAWPNPDGTTPEDCAQEYYSRNEALSACERLGRMTLKELVKLCPWYFEERTK